MQYLLHHCTQHEIQIPGVGPLCDLLQVIVTEHKINEKEDNRNTEHKHQTSNPAGECESLNKGEESSKISSWVLHKKLIAKKINGSKVIKICNQSTLLDQILLTDQQSEPSLQ